MPDLLPGDRAGMDLVPLVRRQAEAGSGWVRVWFELEGGIAQMDGLKSAQSAPKKGRKPYTNFTDERRERFLGALRETGNVSAACKAAFVDRNTAYDEKAKNPEFSAAWEEAKDIAIELMELEAHRRAVKGTLKPVFYQGSRCGSIREYSDTLLIFMLKAGRPEKYRDVVDQRHSGQIGVVSLTIDEWKAQQAERRKQAEATLDLFGDQIEDGHA